MDYLYRVFFIVFSLGILMVVLLPVVLLFRFLVRNCERRYMMWQWKFLFLRSICPFYLSSLFCFFPVWNRRFYVFLGNLGLTMLDKKGVAFGVRDVFSGRISVTSGFRICSILWVVGMILFLFYNMYNKFRLTLILATAKELGENIYEVSGIRLPVQTGILNKQWYLPLEFHASELKWLLRHMEKRGMEPLKRIILMFIFAIHWFNPVIWLYYYLWSKDNEIHADEKAVYHGNLMKRREYAQSIMNFRYRTYSHRNAAGIYEEDRVPDNFGIYAVYERDTESRARRMMYQRWDNPGKKMFARTLVLGVLALYFLLTPLNRVWAGGTWRADSSAKQETEKTADTIIVKKRQVIATADAMSPEGLGRIVRLEMKKGSEQTEEGYDGNFTLVMYDQLGNKLFYLDMDSIFSHSIKSSYHFSKDLILYASDYNEDGKQEITLGQKLVMTQNEFSALIGENEKKAENYDVYHYSMINLQNNQMTVLAQDMYSVTKKNDKSILPPSESITFGSVDGVTGLIYSNFADQKKYYEWSQAEETYVERDYTEAQIEEKKSGAGAAETGQIKEHTIQDANGDTAVLVSTVMDDSSNEEIQSIILSPRNSQSKFEDIKGYYCDLFWAPSIVTGEEEQYAVLLYNGMKSRTFVIYDLESRSVYYKQEDGSVELGKIFQQYNEDDITFQSGGAVLYNLSEKSGDTLKIDFSAMADGNVRVQGSYEYHVKNKATANLSFTRSVDEQEETGSVPTPETGEFMNDTEGNASEHKDAKAADAEHTNATTKPSADAAAGRDKSQTGTKSSNKKKTSTGTKKPKATKKP